MSPEGHCLPPSTGASWVCSGDPRPAGPLLPLALVPDLPHLHCFPTEAAGLYPRQGPDLMGDPLNVGTKPTSGCSPAECVFAVVLTTVSAQSV